MTDKKMEESMLAKYFGVVLMVGAEERIVTDVVYENGNWHVVTHKAIKDEYDDRVYKPCPDGNGPLNFKVKQRGNLSKYIKEFNTVILKMKK